MADHSTFATIRDPTHNTRWQGHSTTDGTAEYASGSIHGFVHDPAHFRSLSLDPHDDHGALTLSSLGIGTYLGEPDDATDEAVENAIIRCVGDGWNVIDTAPVYREGHGELSVGRALRALRLMGGCRREHLFIFTKAGVAANPQILSDFVASFHGVIGADKDSVVTEKDIYEGGLSCWHPRWLEASLDRSLDILQTDTIDLLYLHNPAEILLPHVSRDEFWEKMKMAFEFCERARKEGKIKAYGMATWECFRVPPEDNLYVPLEQVVKLAEEVSCDHGGKNAHHGFRGVMLPVNCSMREAFEKKWQTVDNGKENVTFMEAAEKLGVVVFCSGPLGEGGLLQHETLLKALDASEELRAIDGAGAKLLQTARSVPGLVSVMVGHKTPTHVEQNIALTKVPPLPKETFLKIIEQLPV